MFCFCAASRRLGRTLTARYDAALAGAGITAAQFETLSVLDTLGPSSGRALAAQLALDKTTLSRNVKPLLAAALIDVHSSEDDGRASIYTLTALGRRKLAKAKPLWQSAHHASLESLGAQAASSQRTLQRMVHTLQ
jgi:DNA-binding MarR family transcriptional regulator